MTNRGNRIHAIRRGLLPAAIVFAPVAGAGAGAQEVPRISFGTPVAVFEDGLGSMRGVRELADGRVLVADGFGVMLIVWTPGAGADTLTNVGQGPEEYRAPDGLFPLPDDATLLVDLGNARLTRIASNLDFGDTWPIAQGGMGRGMTMMLPVGTDREGRIYYEEMPGGMTGTPDSAAIARFDPASGETSGVGRVRLPEVNREESGDANNRSVNIRPVPFSARDAWGVAWDGRVAVARADDYRLEWIDPAGELSAGDPVPYEPVRIRRGDQEEWLAALGGGLRVEVESDGGAPRMSMSRAPAGAGDTDARDFEWPGEKPAFPAQAVLIDRQGRAWVRRHVRAGMPNLFDVFDARGRRIAQIDLPEDRRLVAFGEGSVYLTRSDALEFAWLEKYRAPELPR